MKTFFATAALVGAALLTGCASGPFSHERKADSAAAHDMPTRAADGRLVGPNGNTLYTYAKDSQGMSACSDQCAVNWPPLAVAPAAKPMGDYTIVTRADGTRQWAYKGQPLYYFVKDSRAGDMAGEGVGGNWRTVRP
ncbi:COG4315 family predicted lipoprotein [Pulveribacter suum]|uniref:ATP-binding protein n=1 Tax=Pulveribacter suum TaxID=2116657 RepID=A0A2P1NMG0_9BURK|nr:ATP-binding protein [Pulveribacter suum]AVP58241.1 ATP-binding protein [Pulveribacter suum]